VLRPPPPNRKKFGFVKAEYDVVSDLIMLFNCEGGRNNTADVTTSVVSNITKCEVSNLPKYNVV
jgi:hypothetical protein